MVGVRSTIPVDTRQLEMPQNHGNMKSHLESHILLLFHPVAFFSFKKRGPRSCLLLFDLKVYAYRKRRVVVGSKGRRRCWPHLSMCSLFGLKKAVTVGMSGKGTGCNSVVVNLDLRLVELRKSTKTILPKWKMGQCPKG